jgi:hypothetical protein
MMCCSQFAIAGELLRGLQRQSGVRAVGRATVPGARFLMNIVDLRVAARSRETARIASNSCGHKILKRLFFWCMASPGVSRLTIHPNAVEQAAPTSLVVERRHCSMMVK